MVNPSSDVGALMVRPSCPRRFGRENRHSRLWATEFRPSEGAAPRARPSGYILWVEDDVDFARQILRIWRGVLPLVCVPGSLEAIDQAASSTPRLILLDLVLPHYLAEADELEGMRLLDYFRRQHRSVPIIILTAESSVRVHQHLLEQGARDVLTKGGDVREIEELIGRNVEGGGDD